MGGRLAVCEACGAVQKYPDETWLREIRDIYASYDAYPQSGDVDQVMRDPRSGALLPRAAILCGRLAEVPGWPGEGRWLDFGCGAGAMLAAASARFPAWSLFGHDLGRRHIDRLTPIPGFHELYNGAIENIPGRYDLVSLIHAYEHLPLPVSTIAALARTIGPGGRLFIEVSDTATNPFDLVIADHLLHFDADTLVWSVTRAGYDVEVIARDWAPKELSLLATPRRGGAMSHVPVRSSRTAAAVRQQIVWLLAVAEAARALAARGPIGIFGSSIAASWLSGALGDKVAFYVDEDPKRAGRHHLGRPIYAPDQVPAGAPVFIGLVPAIAEAVHKRMSGQGIYHRPPPFPKEC